MALTIDFSDTVKDALDPTKDAKAVAATLFGGIALSTQPARDGMDYDDLYEEAFDALDLNFIRFPDGELPDGFAIENAEGTWRFDHNELNGGSGDVTDPETGAPLDPAIGITTEYLQGLTPAMSLTYPELIHPICSRAMAQAA
ncbi:hypothetical protein [Aliiroseovarius sp.]|uniref:hypothetical protein n=1 Tax=Aliiroseovarius sp. TaxID=1872442 RepID=UPI003BAC259D